MSQGMLQSFSGGASTESQLDLDVLLVQIEQEYYALPSSSVREVARYRPWTPVPSAPMTLPGIINQRGVILPVVEPRPLFGLEQAELTRAARLVVLMHNDIGMALLVEAVLDLISLPASSLEPVPAGLDPTRARLLRGILRHEEKVIGLIDLDELISILREAS
jgi:purine-binding chemotaxis protein CheW